MNILIVGNDIGLVDNLELYSKRALELLGNKVFEFDCLRSTFLKAKKLESFKLILRKVKKILGAITTPIIKIDQQRMSKQLLDTVSDSNIDLVIVFKGQSLKADTLIKIKEMKKDIVLTNWLTDFPLTALSEEIYPLYDCIFLPFPRYVDALYNKKAKCVKHLAYACDPQMHIKKELSGEDFIKYSRDICFVGSWYPEREELFEQLADFNFGIWGKGWDRIKKDSKLKNHVKDCVLKAEEWTKVYSGSKICLNLHRIDFKTGGGTIMRTFESLSCGILLLTEETEDVRNLFSPGEDLVCFNTAEELKQLVKYYLSHDEERKSIALRGQKTVQAKHTYVHRMKQLLSIAEEIKKGF